jgi:hypothetical protein
MGQFQHVRQTLGVSDRYLSLLMSQKALCYVLGLPFSSFRHSMLVVLLVHVKFSLPHPPA